MTLYDPDDDLDTLRTKGLLLGMVTRKAIVGEYFSLLRASDTGVYFFDIERAEDAGFTPIISENDEATLLRRGMDLYEKGCPAYNGRPVHRTNPQSYIFRDSVSYFASR